MVKFLTCKEAAGVLRLSQWEVRIRCADGRIKASKPGKSWLISESDLLEYIEAHSNQQASA